MSLHRKIAHNTIIQIVGKGASTLLGLLAVAIMTRSLGVEKFGYYATAVGWLQFIGIICDFGFIVTTAKMLSEPRFDKQKLFNNLFTWRLLTAVVFQGLAAGGVWFFPYPHIVKIATAILALSFIANILNQVFVGFYQTRLRMATQMAGEVIGRVALVAGIGLLAYGRYDFLPMMGVVTGAAWIYTFYLWAKSDGVKLEINQKITAAIYRAMWPTALAVIFNGFYLQGDRVLLPLYAPVADVAFYGAAYRVLDIMSQVAFMTMGVMLPLLTFAWSRQQNDDFKKYYQLSFDLMLLVLLPIVAGTVALAEPLMRLVAGNDFAGAGKILSLLALSTLGVCFGMTFGQIAIAVSQQQRAMWVYFANAVLAVIAYFIFIPRYGMYGAAYVTIGSEFFAGLLLFLFCVYHTRLWPRFFTAGKILLASGLMGAAIVYFQPLNIALSILSGIVIYGALILILRVVSKETIVEIFHRPQLPENR